MQALQFLAETYDWPSRVLKLSPLGFLIGLPILLVLAWYHGDRGEQRIRGSEAATVLLLFLVAGGVFWLYEPASDAPGSSVAVTANASDRAPIPDEKSIAVLPFADMSMDELVAYWGEGCAYAYREDNDRALE